MKEILFGCYSFGGGLMYPSIPQFVFPRTSVYGARFVKLGAIGITTVKRARRLGPKRASHIRKLYKLEAKDDPRPFAIKRPRKNPKKVKTPKIQRLVTANRIRRKKAILKIKTERIQATKDAVKAYKTVMDAKKAKAKAEKLQRKKSEGKKEAPKAAKPADAPKA